MNRPEVQTILMRILDQIELVDVDENDDDRIYMVCCWAHQANGQTTFGWSGTDDPAFVSANLLRVVADHIGDTESLEEELDPPDDGA